MERPLLCYVINRARRFNEMIECLEVDPLKLVRLRHGETYAEARTACLHCREAENCVSWIELGATEQPHFCPSFALFDSLRRTRQPT